MFGPFFSFFFLFFFFFLKVGGRLFTVADAIAIPMILVICVITFMFLLCYHYYDY